MRKLTYISLALALCLGSVSCQQKKETNTYIVTRKAETTAPKGVVDAPDRHWEGSVEWRGKEYASTIQRAPMMESPTVKDDEGLEYHDNSVTLTVRRSDGTVFFERVFTKDAFAAYLDENFRSHGLLSGFVFDVAEESYLQFAVSVDLPKSDDYAPLLLKLSYDGSIRVEKDLSI